MIKKLLVVSVIIMVGMLLVMSKSKTGSDLVNPFFGQSMPTPSGNPSPTPASPQAPKTFKFDRSTDLEAELEKVNPQVLDSDFE